MDLFNEIAKYRLKKNNKLSQITSDDDEDSSDNTISPPVIINKIITPEEIMNKYTQDEVKQFIKELSGLYNTKYNTVEITEEVEEVKPSEPEQKIIVSQNNIHINPQTNKLITHAERQAMKISEMTLTISPIFYYQTLYMGMFRPEKEVKGCLPEKMQMVWIKLGGL